MRNVVVYEWKKLIGKPPEKVEAQAGIFHQWGVAYEEFETGPGNYSTAIVELTDGTIITPPAYMVQFIS